VAPNKLLAKMASEFNKPNGISIVYESDVQAPSGRWRAQDQRHWPQGRNQLAAQAAPARPLATSPRSRANG
jgi:hypothetical protein